MRKRYTLADGVAEAKLIKDGDSYWVDSIEVLPESIRGEGLGTQLLQLIIDDADSECVILRRHPQPFGKIYLDELQLIEWYERHGFVEMEDTIEMTMQRTPNGC